nr:DNA methyltransferase [Mycobacteroides chelonae]
MTAPHLHTDAVQLWHGDCRDVLAQLPDASVDSVVTDPPYELGFGGKAWDSTGIAFDTELWAECLRVLKPGGHLLAFGASRTWHRLAVAVEDAGFELRDSIAWLRGNGMPKSVDLTDAMERHLAGERYDDTGPSPDLYAVTAYLRQARDAAGWSNKRIDELFGTHGMAGHWTTKASQPACPSLRQWAELKSALAPHLGDDVDELVHRLCSTERPDDWGTRTEADGGRFLGSLASGGALGGGGAFGTGLKPAFEPIVVGRKPLTGTAKQTVLAYGTGALHIGACRIGEERRWPPNVILDDEASAEVEDQFTGASRFFPTFRYAPKAPPRERPTADGVAHQTVKPLDLMRFLVRLVTPPGGTVLDPFAGSGTTTEAALLEGFSVITAEREPSYLPLIEQRIDRATAQIATPASETKEAA